MLFNTIKNTTSSISVIAICFVSLAILYFSIQEHEKLYFESVKGDLDALSENMSSDLVPLLAEQPDEFELATMLLRLDRYDNVKYAFIYDNSWLPLQSYQGKAFPHLHTKSLEQYGGIKTKLPDVHVDKDELVALKLIGDELFPLGYLRIVLDSSGPLNKSKQSLLKQVLPITLLLLIVVFSFLLWVQERLFFPLSRLSRIAQKIQKTHDYSLKINIKGKHEVTSLSSDLNLMMETINQETQKNKQYTDRLMEQQEVMEQLASFDTLTGLPNRQFFMDTLKKELTEAQDEVRDLTLMYFDLDGFKGVNDSFGHEIGDLVLIEVCRRTKLSLREGDLISRIGGDEFLVLLHNEPSEIELLQISERLVNNLNVPFKVRTWEIHIGVSIGIAKASDSNFNVSEFISNADTAMYRSKLTGRSRHTLFIPEMMEEHKRRLLIANSIANAIKYDEFCLHYQGKVNFSRDIVGYEALIRWNSDALGGISPAEFIPIAEQSGKVLSITKWVIKRVCIEIEHLIALHGNQLVISLNLSAFDIKNIALVDYIKEMFAQYGVSASNIEFEVTESAYLDNFELANEFISQLRGMGCSIALDDFGAGYSSLGYLTKIDLNTLKIDKQFVDHLCISKKNTLITKSIIQMAKQLDLKVCAEGVETNLQADYLIAHGCNQLQGYLFSKPTNLADIKKLFLDKKLQ
ncbi:EAL domain-containing protein [Paraglaciecola sp.]|uniref:putative bifunctional diguanylate cyclase/phosphodiesterase n=1 Tax=Paraglaciecola sp. TaxID=1920173 RepID=UPI0032663A4F